MIALRELLADLYARDVRLWLDGEQLRFRAPKGVLTPELLHAQGPQVRDHRLFATGRSR